MVAKLFLPFPLLPGEGNSIHNIIQAHPSIPTAPPKEMGYEGWCPVLVVSPYLVGEVGFDLVQHPVDVVWLEGISVEELGTTPLLLGAWSGKVRVIWGEEGERG